METLNSAINEEVSTKTTNNDAKLNTYTCTTCSNPVEIYEINENKDLIPTIKFKCFKCLNPNKEIKEMPINEYIEAMKKNTYLYSECSLCKKKQNDFKDTQFSYCIKCNVVICPKCLENHLETNKENHLDSNTEFIINNDEKNVRCFLHPEEKYIGFCFDCNRHICKKCMKSKEHKKHRKNSLLEVEVTEEMKDILNNIRNIYKKKIKIESKKKELNNDLCDLRIKFEKEAKLRRDKFKNYEDKINKNPESSTDQDEDEEIFKEDLEDIKKEYDETNSENDKIIEVYQSLLTIIQILRNTQEKYSENYYYNNNINNIIYNYYKCEDENIKKILNDDVYNQLKTKDEVEKKFYDEKKKKKLAYNNPKIKKVSNRGTNNEITIIYTTDKEKEGVYIFGKKFAKTYKKICKMIINNGKEEKEICNYISYEDLGINKNDGSFSIILIGINEIRNANDMFRNCYTLHSIPDIKNWNTKNVHNISGMFRFCKSIEFLPDISNWNTKNINNMSYFCDGCSSLQSLPDISKWDTTNVTDMGNMFNKCSSLKSLPDIDKWNILKVKNKLYMFDGCPASLNIPSKFL